MKAYYCDQFVLPLPTGHRFPMGKYRLLRDSLLQQLPEVMLVDAPAATPGELALAHAPDYIDAVLQGHLSARQQREIGFPWSPAMAERACRSVGATIAAAEAALQEGVAANLAGGTHHASAQGGSGFCVFNDVAVAARLMQARWHQRQRQRPRDVPRLMRVAVIDLDVHQGNGTAEIFGDDPSVLTFSMHGENNFPFDKQPGDLDIGLPDGTGDEAYLAALDEGLAALWRLHGQGEPDLVFYNAGVDPHEGDRLGRLNLSAAGLAERDRRVFAACVQRGIPVAMVMGGGYGPDIDSTVGLQLATYGEALAAWRMRQAGAGLAAVKTG